MDHVTRERRSAIMAAVASKDTRPEMAVRRVLHRLGYRFRLHRTDLPGRPDIVLPKHRVCIFVHGCFWHRHDGCKKSSTPKSNVAFWETKFARNTQRDAEAVAALKALGWNVSIVWECETRQPDQLLDLLGDVVGCGHRRH